MSVRPQRSPWKLAAVPLGLGSAAVIFLETSRFALGAQRSWIPGGAFYCAPTAFAAFVMLAAIALLSIAAGFLCANLLLWLIPAARASLERHGPPFARANRQLLRFLAFAALVLVPLGIGASRSSVCLANDTVYSRDGWFGGLRAQPKSQIVALRATCQPGGRGSWKFGEDLEMRDGSGFDLASVGPWYARAAGEVGAWLRGLPVDTAGVDPACPAGLRQRILP